MEADIATVATLFAALAMLQVGLFAWLRADMRRMEERLRDDARRTEERLRAELAASEERLRGEIAALESRTNERFERVEERLERLEARMAAVEHGQAKLEGLLEGLREAIAGRARQAAE